MESVFEKAGITYTLAEDGRYYPDLKLPEDEAPRYGKYGRMCKAFLKEHRQGFYTQLLLNGKLIRHLNEVNNEVHAQMELIVRQMAEKQGVNEALKARDQMAWVGAMNSIRNAAEEIVLSKLICE